MPNPHDPPAHAPAGQSPAPRRSADHYRRQLETVANNATLALFIMDEHQHCTYMNPAAERLTGFSLADVQGRPLHDCVHHTRPDGSPYPLSECPIDQAFPQNLREQGTEVFIHPDGHFYPVAFTASPILDEGGRPTGTIIEVRDITEERRAAEERERLLRELETERGRLATVFREAPALIATVRGPDHVFEMVNMPYQALVGNRPLLGLPVREALPEIAAQGFVDLLDRVRRTGQPYVGTEVPLRLAWPAGAAEEVRFFDFVYQPLARSDGSVEGILAHGVEVTDRVRARQHAEEQAAELEQQAEELQLQTARLEALVDNAPVGIVLAEAPSGRILTGNRRAEEILRHPVRHSAGVEAYGEWVAFHPDGRRVLPREYPLARAIATGERVGPDEYRYRRGDGTLAWVQVTGAPIRDAGGRVIAGLVVIDDVDAAKRAEEERERLLARIRQERALLRDVFEHAPAVMALYAGPEQVIELVNPSWERTVGKPGAVGRPFREVFPEFAGTGLFEVLDRVYREGNAYVNPEIQVPLERWGSGVVEDTYWSLAYLPLPARADGGRDVLVHAVEMTAQVRAREQVAALSRAALAVHSAPGLTEALQAITEEARSIIGAHQSITSLSTGAGASQSIFAVSLSDKYAAWRGYDVPPNGSGIYSVVAEGNRPVRLTQEELQRHPRWRAFGEHAREHPPMRGWLAAPLVGPDGGNIGMIQLSDRYSGEFTAQDEAVLVQLAQLASVAVENARLYEQAVEANRVKSDFLATMSHELRTPLNAMIGYAQLLELGVPEAIGEAPRRQVERIRLSAQHLLQLIEEILTFSRVEAGRERVEVQPVALGELLREVAAILEPLAQQKRLRFRIDAPAAEVTLRTDPRKLRQILLNLLGNAIKFTEQGEVRFGAEVEGGDIRFEVVDTGIGIATEHLERIWEPFWQAETDIHARVSGTGLGLPVTRQLVGLLGGTLRVESTPGVGTLFRLQLPLGSEG